MNVKVQTAPILAQQLDRPAGASAREAAQPPIDRNPLRVLLVVESSGAGTGRHVLDLAEGLSTRGHEVHIIYSTGRAEECFLAGLAQLQGVRSLPLAMKTEPHPSDISVVRAVRRYMREFGPFDIIHGHSSKGGGIARLAAFATRTRVFYTMHGLTAIDPHLSWPKWLLYLGIERLLALKTERLIAVSPEEQRATVRLGFPASKVLMIPNGVGEMALAPRAKARREMGVPEDAIVIGFVGRMVKQKAPAVLIQAFAAAARFSPKSYLAMVGAGPLDASLRELTMRLGVSDKVIWLGARDARTVFAGFDLFAIASRKEGLPYVVLEAMYAGLPIVATAASGIEILVIPGSNGVVVPTDDVSAFAQALTSITNDPQRMDRYSKASRERVLEFNIDGMVQSTLNAYCSARPSTLTTGAQTTADVAYES